MQHKTDETYHLSLHAPPTPLFEKARDSCLKSTFCKEVQYSGTGTKTNRNDITNVKNEQPLFSNMCLSNTIWTHAKMPSSF